MVPLWHEAHRTAPAIDRDMPLTVHVGLKHRDICKLLGFHHDARWSHPKATAFRLARPLMEPRLEQQSPLMSLRTGDVIILLCWRYHRHHSAASLVIVILLVVQTPSNFT